MAERNASEGRYSRNPHFFVNKTPDYWVSPIASLRYVAYHRGIAIVRPPARGRVMLTRRCLLMGIGAGAIFPTFRVAAQEKPNTGEARFIGKWDVTVQG